MSFTPNGKNLAPLVLPYLDVAPDSLQFQPIPTGKHNQSYWLECDAERYVLRIAPPDNVGFLFYEYRMMQQEPELHELILNRTDIPAAEIVCFDFTRKLIDRDYLLMKALPGKPVSDAQITQNQFQVTLEQVGQHLRQLHKLTAIECLGKREYGYLGKHRPMQPQSTWVTAFHLMWNKLLDDVVACGSYTATEADLMRKLLDQHIHHFDREVESRLLHMDVWSQNILVNSRGGVTGLVDFDRALWGDIEIEFAVLDYCGISEPSFWAGYGEKRDTSFPAMIRRQFYLLYEVQKYMPIRVWRRNDLLGAERYKRQCLQMAAYLTKGDVYY